MQEIQLSGNCASGNPVVARDHHHLDAGPARRLDRAPRLGPRRVDHSGEPEEHQALTHQLGRDLVDIRGQVTAGKTEHAQSLRSEGVVGLVNPCAHVGREGPRPQALATGRLKPGARTRLALIIREDARAHFKHALGCALHEEPALAFRPGVKRGHVTLVWIEGDLIYARVVRRQVRPADACLGRGDEEGTLGRVAGDGPPALFLAQARIVAERSGAEEEHQAGLIGRLDPLAL